jgi:hypothetical protein
VRHWAHEGCLEKSENKTHADPGFSRDSRDPCETIFIL